jgi:hypothetical protein
MDVTMLLCDGADAVGGKLYILGGGWSQILVPNIPVNMALAVKLFIPWDRANEPHAVVARLLDSDGEPVELGGEEVKAEAEIETGRPPGLKPGTALDAPFVVNFPAVALDNGGYVWELEIDGKVEARAPFQVGPPERKKGGGK